MLIRHPLLTWNEYVRIKTGLALGDPDPLDQGEADTIDPVWLQEFVSMVYEPVPGAAKVCPNCGWTGYSCETLRNFSKRLNAAAKGGTR